MSGKGDVSRYDDVLMTCLEKGDVAGDVTSPDILEIALRSDWPV